MKKYLRSDTGFALVSCIIVSFLLLSAVIAYTRFTHSKSKDNQQVVAQQRALLAADAGVHLAVDWLRKPQASSLSVEAPLTLDSSDTSMPYSVRMVRQSVDTSLIDIWSTGSVQLPSEKTPREAVVYAQVKQQNIGAYIVASPNTVEITYGSVFGAGNIYGKDVIFDSGIGGTRTRVRGVYYFNSISPANPETFVNFVSGPPVKVTAEPNMPAAYALENDYIAMAASDIIPADSVLTGAKGLPSNIYRVYYCPGDVTLGTASTAFGPSASFLIYAAGNITIGNSLTIDGATNSVGLFAKGDILISSSTPNSTILRGLSLLTDGKFTALGSPRAASLSFTGSMIVNNGISVGNIFVSTREYTYRTPDSRLPMPYMTQLMSYKVLSGKYAQ